jgi:hypothetical protein
MRSYLSGILGLVMLATATLAHGAGIERAKLPAVLAKLLSRNRMLTKDYTARLGQAVIIPALEAGLLRDVTEKPFWRKYAMVRGGGAWANQAAQAYLEHVATGDVHRIVAYLNGNMRSEKILHPSRPAQ